MLGFICQGMWRYRNDAIFNNKKQHIVVNCNKIIGFFLEHFREDKTKNRLIIDPVISEFNVVDYFDGVAHS